MTSYEGAQMSLTCRICGNRLERTFVDLGMSPPCEDFLSAARIDQGEMFYPLHVRICEACLLVQLPSYIPPDQIFTDEYAYHSSYSTSWIEHARRYADTMTETLQLGPDSLVVEVASNDGYLLQHFVGAGVPVLGIEPAGNVADIAIDKGIPTEKVFLGVASGREIARRFGRADLMAGNNVFAHVPDLHDFVGGLAEVLAESGTLTLEFPHLQRLIEHTQYDTIYHEHFSYFTLRTAQRALALGGLVVVDVEELPSHGGSLRLFVRHADSAGEVSPNVAGVLEREASAGLHTLAGFDGFADQVDRVKADFLTFLIEAKATGRSVAGYGAPGKGNTMLNHCGVRADLLPFTVDMNPNKHGMYLPGSHIPVLAPEEIAESRPDYIVILPWNLRQEISDQLSYVRDWGGRFVVAIPKLEVW
jgi:SAM-dependent methyltransferase